jgi:5-methylcytosine-specific restriction endonuclease McrA
MPSKDTPEYRAAERERKHQHYLANKDAYVARARARELAHPEETRERKRLGARRYYSEHPEERRAYAKRHRIAHPEKIAAAKKRYRLTHSSKRVADNKRRRARHYNAPVNDFTHQQWVEMQIAYDHRCAYCKRRAKGHLTQDHIIPLIHGGSHTLWNIVPACRNCNTNKGTKPPAVPIQPLLITVAAAKPHKTRRAS